MTTVLSPSGVELPDGGEPHSRAQVNRNFTKINDLWNKAGLGLQAIVEATTGGSATTVTQVEQNIASFTFKANRWYLIEWATGITTSAATGTSNALAQIFSCSTSDASNLTTGLTELMGYNIVSTGNQTVRVNPKRLIKYTVDTTLQIKATITPNGITLTRAAGATFPSQLSITDLGANI